MPALAAWGFCPGYKSDREEPEDALTRCATQQPHATFTTPCDLTRREEPRKRPRRDLRTRGGTGSEHRGHPSPVYLKALRVGSPPSVRVFSAPPRGCPPADKDSTAPEGHATGARAPSHQQPSPPPHTLTPSLLPPPVTAHGPSEWVSAGTRVSTCVRRPEVSEPLLLG